MSEHDHEHKHDHPHAVTPIITGRRMSWDARSITAASGRATGAHAWNGAR